MNRVIYGEHDDPTIAQFDKCLTFGSAAGGVLCADGHLGYAHPIGGVVDESPQAYRRIVDVISSHANTINIHHVLTPVGVIMAGNEIDPYKD